MYKDYGWKTKNKEASALHVWGVVRKHLSKKRNRCILDMGCGRGEFANSLIGDGFCAYGVDGSREGVDIAEEKNSGHFFVMDFEADALPEGLKGLPFDTIVSTEVVEHLYSPRAYVELCNRILPVGGVLLVTTPYHGWLKNVVLAVSGKLDRHFTALWEGGHIKFWSRRTLPTLLENAGFRITGFKGIGRVPYLWKSMLVIAEKMKEI